MCIVCRNKGAKESFVRIVKNANGISVDYDGKTNGRGVYICKNKKCIDEAIKRKAINRGFKTECPTEIYKELESIDGYK